MKQILIVITILSVSFFFSYSQEDLPKSKKKKTHLFNYEKNRTFLSLGLNFSAFKNKEISIVNLGHNIGFGFFPVNNFSLAASFDYIHGFNNPHDDLNLYTISLRTKYFFIPKKKLSPFIGVTPNLTLFTYRANPMHLDFIFYNDDPNNKIQNHFIPTLTFLAGLSIKIWNFTLPLELGYIYKGFYKKSGRRVGSPIHGSINLNYNFNLKKNKKLKINDAVF